MLAHSLWKFQSDHSFWLNLYAFSPELEFRLNSDVKYEILALTLKSADRWVMTDLLYTANQLS